jgi:methionyl-tRNA formyltransferase
VMVGLLGKGLNRGTWEEITSVLGNKHIPFIFFENHKDITIELDLVISLGYSQIISDKYLRCPKNGIVVFHSSDLPEGRGWAPLYYTIIEKKACLVQSLFYATTRVDAGPIIAKAFYPIEAWYDLHILREIDDHLTIALCDAFISQLVSGVVPSHEQEESKATYWQKRSSDDSEIDPQKSIMDLYDTFRALSDVYPPFFTHQGKTMRISLKRNTDFNYDPRKTKIVSCG